MNESQISIRYAKALFQGAIENRMDERVYRDMELLARTCRVADFRQMLVMPTLQTSKKHDLVQSVLGESLSKLSLSMIKLAISNKREGYLEGIARNYRDIYRKARKIKKATMSTAQETTEETRRRIMELIRKAYDSEVELSAEVDSDLIGGFVLTVEDRQYDASVSSSLARIRKKLLITGIEKN